MEESKVREYQLYKHIGNRTRQEGMGVRGRW
jgi:hypothetical protein